MTVAAQTERTRVLAPGARIGKKLEILRHLGEGGMGALWVARNLTTEAEVAIKVLRAQREDDVDKHTAERFRHEAKLGAMLAHRNITQVFDLLEDDDGSLVLVMELLRGETLQDSCEKKGALSGKDAVAIIVPILGALQHAHDHGVVHRDIKPSNIFLHVDPDGHATPKLLDFGIAKMEDSSIKTVAGNVLGTPSYMSPEQVRASGQLDGRSDIFSVGSLLYTIITGENPFRTDAPSGTLARVLELEVDPDPRIEPRLWQEIQRALSKQPYERHASASEFAAALCEAVGEAPPPVSLRRDKAAPRIAAASVASLPTPAPAKSGGDTELNEAIASLPKPRSRAMLAISGAAIVLAIGGLYAVVASLRSPKPETAEKTAPAAAETKPEATTVSSAPSSEAPVAAASSQPPAVPTTSSAAPTKPPPRRPLTRPLPSATAPSIARTPGF